MLLAVGRALWCHVHATLATRRADAMNYRPRTLFFICLVTLVTFSRSKAHASSAIDLPLLLRAI